MENNLKVVENDLVPVYETSTGEKVVYGRELWEVLEVRSNYREWIIRRFRECDAIENEDFQGVEISTVVGGTPKKDHIIKLDTAKEMAMLERNEKGKQVRRYFIEIEKRYKNKTQVPRTIDDQIRLLAVGHIELVEKVDKIADGMKSVVNRIDIISDQVGTVQNDFDSFKNDMTLLLSEADHISMLAKRKGVSVMGGKDSGAYGDRSIRMRVYQDIYWNLKHNFGVSTYKNIKRKDYDSAVEFVKKYELPSYLTDMVSYANRI